MIGKNKIKEKHSRIHSLNGNQFNGINLFKHEKKNWLVNLIQPIVWY